MGKLMVMNGTPMGNAHLCQRCSHGQYTVGYRESEAMVICTNSEPARQVPFVVRECTEFWDRHRPIWEQMSQLALNFGEQRRRPTPGFRTNGFSTVPVVVPDDEDDDEAEAARLRD